MVGRVSQEYNDYIIIWPSGKAPLFGLAPKRARCRCFIFSRFDKLRQKPNGLFATLFLFAPAALLGLGSRLAGQAFGIHEEDQTIFFA